MAKIKALKKLGLSQAMIANEMGVTRQTVNAWFRGVTTPTAKSILRMAAAMSKLTGKTITAAFVYTLIENTLEECE